MNEELNQLAGNEQAQVSSLQSKGIKIFMIFFLSLCCIGVLILGGIGGGSYWIIQNNKGKVQEAATTATALPEWPLVYQDDFSKNLDKWWTGSYAGTDYYQKYAIKDGIMTWDISTNQGYVFWDNPDIDEYSDFSISVDVKHVNGHDDDSFGLIFRDSANNYYTFMINDHQVFSVYAHYLDNWITLINYTYEPSIKIKDWNKVSVRAEGNRYYFFINDKLVGDIQDDRLTGGEIGMMIDTWSGPNPVNPNPQGIAYRPEYQIHTVVAFDNFELRAPESALSDKDQRTTLPEIKPEPGKIVFASNRDGNRNIYLINSDGTGQTQLTDNLADDYSPKWSPDGKKIAFVSLRNGNADIYIMDADGKNQIRITDNEADDFSPDWSPDGKQLVFVSLRDEKRELYVMNIQDGDEKPLKLTAQPAIDEDFPAWSLTGGKIAFQGTMRKQTDILTIEPNGNNQYSFTRGGDYFQPAWSSDGTQMAYAYHSEKDAMGIAVYDYMDKDYDYILSETQNLQYPSWSPNGEQIIFTSDRAGQVDIYITLKNGSGLFRVTHNEAIEESPDWIAR